MNSKLLRPHDKPDCERPMNKIESPLRFPRKDFTAKPATRRKRIKSRISTSGSIILAILNLNSGPLQQLEYPPGPDSYESIILNKKHVKPFSIRNFKNQNVKKIKNLRGMWLSITVVQYTVVDETGIKAMNQAV